MRASAIQKLEDVAVGEARLLAVVRQGRVALDAAPPPRRSSSSSPKGTPGASQRTVFASVSETPMRPWSSRSLTKAMRSESGDRTGSSFSPKAAKSGSVVPASKDASAAGSTGAWRIWPPFVHSNQATPANAGKRRPAQPLTMRRRTRPASVGHRAAAPSISGGPAVLTTLQAHRS